MTLLKICGQLNWPVFVDVPCITLKYFKCIDCDRFVELARLSDVNGLGARSPVFDYQVSKGLRFLYVSFLLYCCCVCIFWSKTLLVLKYCDSIYNYISISVLKLLHHCSFVKPFIVPGH